MIKRETFLTIKRLIVLLGILQAPFSIASGVEFVERSIHLKKEALKSFSQNLSSTSYDPKTGYNDLKFQFTAGKDSSPRNMSAVNYILRQKNGETHGKYWDPQGDGFFDTIKRKVEGRSFIYEELYSYNGGNFHSFRVRYYPQSEGEFYRVVSEKRNQKSDDFVLVDEYQVRRFQMGGDLTQMRQCLDRRAFIIDMNLSGQVNAILDHYLEEWPAPEDELELTFTAEFEKSCDKKLKEFTGRNTRMDQLYEEAINEGISCLQKLSSESQDLNALSRTLYINAAGALVGRQIFEYPMSSQAIEGREGQMPRRAPAPSAADYSPNQKVLCSQSQQGFAFNGLNGREEGLGRASTKVGEEAHVSCNGSNLKVKHPYVSLNFKKLKKDYKNYPDKERKVKELLFHEFLHTTGIEHKAHLDPVNLCAQYCFDMAANREARELAKRGCQGDRMGEGTIESLAARVQTQRQFNFHSSVPSTNFDRAAIQELIRIVPDRAMAERVLQMSGQ